MSSLSLCYRGPLYFLSFVLLYQTQSTGSHPITLIQRISWMKMESSIHRKLWSLSPQVRNRERKKIIVVCNVAMWYLLSAALWLLQERGSAQGKVWPGWRSSYSSLLCSKNSLSNVQTPPTHSTWRCFDVTSINRGSPITWEPFPEQKNEWTYKMKTGRLTPMNKENTALSSS